MKTILLLILSLFLVVGCNSDSLKVRKQKTIYFSVSEVPQKELEKELTRTMETQHLDTPGKAMLYLLDQSIAFLPQVDAMVNHAASQTGLPLPPQDPLDVTEDKIKTTRQVRTLLEAREAIARIEMEADN